MEILSPAGSFDSLRAAVHYGADAVYVGAQRFSARKSAQNFSDAELAQAVDFCHLRGVKLYLCCNTLMKETELNDAMRLAYYAYQIGVDALIIQDLGLLKRIRQELPDFPVHASTQMTVVNSAGVKQLTELGVRRVVLAREVSKAQLKEIQKNTQAELEVFVHGALCMSYSGQCLMSSILGGRSGNRGGCAQPCRLSYTLLKNGKPMTQTGTLLCPKDLCLADRVSELAELGVASLKIEGRMKSPEYVAMVTQVYKKAAQGSISQEEIGDMLKFFSRGGSCSGYFDGCSYENMMDNGAASKIARTLPVLEKKEKKVPVSVHLSAVTGQPLSLSMVAESGTCFRAEGAICEAAHTKPTTKERMQEQVEKLGETPFYAGFTEVLASPDVAVPVKEINGLRRQVAEGLANQLAQEHKRSLPAIKKQASEVFSQTRQLSLCVEVKTKEQLLAAVEQGIERVYLPADLWPFSHLVKEPVLQMPPILREFQQFPKGSFDAVCVQNIGQIAFAGVACITAGHRMNVTNSETALMLKEWGVSRAVLSPELSAKAIADVRAHTDLHLEAIAYGRLPLMLLENCVIRSAYGCKCDGARFALLDRKNETFPILPLRCGNEIYNSKPIYMADRMHDLKQLGLDSLRLLFTFEDKDTTQKVIKAYQKALAGGQLKAPQFGYTRGHFYRGMQ